MDNFGIKLFTAFIGSIPALLFALWVERQRMPKLKITTSEESNADNTYQAPNTHAGQRWKFFRVSIENKGFVFPFNWIPRQTAENCRGFTIEIINISAKEKPLKN